MDREIQRINHEIAQVEQAIAGFEESLERARQLKHKLEIEKAEQERRVREEQEARQKAEALRKQQEEEEMQRREQEAAPARAASAALQQQTAQTGSVAASKESPEELQRRIQELQRQIMEMENKKKEDNHTNPQPTVEEDEDEIIEEFVEEEYEEEIIEEIVEDEEDQPASSAAPAHPDAPVGPSCVAPNASSVVPVPAAFSRSAVTAAPASPRAASKPRTAAPVNRPSSSVSSASPIRSNPPPPVAAVASSPKKKIDWEKPAWALPSTEVETEGDIIRESIKSPFLKARQHNGYVRQVQPKDNLEIIKGKFVASKPSNTDARLAWIVVEINKRKVGKIVMHLYGKDVNGLVDKFIDLKGCDLEYGPKKPIVVLGVEPKLYVTTQSAKGLDSKKDVYGVVEEGHDIVALVQSTDQNADVKIKQAHIYPVKKARGT